jgi:hypothetical protein
MNVYQALAEMERFKETIQDEAQLKVLSPAGLGDLCR